MRRCEDSPPLTALRAFEAAARHLSFKAAADELGLTPTAISHQIRLLETVAGRALFRRRPRPLALTSAGAALLPVVRSSFDTIADAFTAVRDEAASPQFETANVGSHDRGDSTSRSDAIGPGAGKHFKTAGREPAAAFFGRAAVCKYRRRSPTGLFYRRHHRKPHH